QAIDEALKELDGLDPAALRKARAEKFLSMGRQGAA
ncbi:MAG TPA: acetyl-CoA carboxylase carboxyl transferase subunit alpha, partial [Alphaproteobacteria bacterium]|nr:acetyl-CoA carboxylase carboxyl transferase subunit alpha [Alphaproteobacteria bacterium]